MKKEVVFSKGYQLGFTFGEKCYRRLLMNKSAAGKAGYVEAQKLNNEESKIEFMKGVSDWYDQL